jgi:hypothetical protein
MSKRCSDDAAPSPKRRKERDNIGTDEMKATIWPLAALIQSTPLVMPFRLGDVVTNFYTWRTGIITFFDGGWPGWMWIKYGNGDEECRKFWSCSKQRKRKHSDLAWR